VEDKELTVVDEKELVPANVFGTELAEGPKVSQMLREVMNKKEKKVFFNGKEYAEFSDLQVISDYYGLSIKTHASTPVEIHRVKGFKAEADLINANGIVVGGAEAYCMQDEVNWAKKPLFQLSSMAQTRAACKAISNRYRWVVAMAGYGTTPAEELPQEEPQKVATGGVTGLPAHLDKRTITEKQAKRFYAIAKSAGKSDDTIKVYLKAEFGAERTSYITADRYESSCEWAAKVQ